MLLSNAKTWTIVLILYILPKCTFSVAIGNRELTSKTLFQALVAKFPQVENTTLRETLSEIFISSCSNWTAIENAKPIIPDKDYVPCRLLYESIDSFLTSVGKQYVLSKSFVDTIMSSKHSLQDICIGNKSFSSHFSALSTKKDLSAYLEETICLFSCIDTSKSLINQSLNMSIDTCNVAYFFATFDVPKFLADSKSSLKKSNYQTKEENKDPLLKVSEDQATAPKVESKVGDDDSPLSVVSQAGFQKSKQKYTNKKSLGHMKDEQQPLTDKANEKSTQGESVNGVLANKSQDNKLSIDEGKIENKNDITEASVENVAVISSIKPEIKPIGKTEVLQDEKSLNSPAKDLSNADKTAVESDNNNNRENQGDISLDNDNEKDEADPGIIGDESETAKQEENVQSIHSHQTEPKKPKPNTLDADEPASSVNIVDDDMDGDSYFFSYFTVLMCLVIVGYVGYHNRQKVLALLLEGKRGKRNGRNVRRPNSANYHKLDSNLEEAMSSSCTKNTSNVIY
ncbi:trans-Golgi network integral membrane protein 1-like [Euwallacea fornicatus]|uniref:trans-Golgi network integral membrane protein 1-like n=1 Tax=Euwallacea fornicatus TaxID=995702 RepID=UPI00338ECE5D